MTDDRIGEIWRLPENYCKPLAFGRAIEAECRKELNALRDEERMHELATRHFGTFIPPMALVANFVRAIEAECRVPQPEKADSKTGDERANGNAVLVPCDQLAQMKDRIAELEATIEAQRTLYANCIKISHEADELEHKCNRLERQQAVLVEALEKLARLGNGEHYGNSECNCIAIAALASVKGNAEVTGVTTGENDAT